MSEEIKGMLTAIEQLSKKFDKTNTQLNRIELRLRRIESRLENIENNFTNPNKDISEKLNSHRTARKNR